MKRSPLSPALALLLFAGVLRGQQTAPVVALDPKTDWKAPQGWKTETIPFPLEFAPSLAHQGSEELRFAPGMFKAGEPGYWSYGFVWWVEDRPLQSTDALAGELTAYFRGLLVRVGNEKKLTIDPARIAVTLHDLRRKDEDGWHAIAGEGTILDAFGDGRLVNLTLWVYQRDYSAQKRRAVLVLASPAPADAPIWKSLHDLRDSFPR